MRRSPGESSTFAAGRSFTVSANCLEPERLHTSSHTSKGSVMSSRQPLTCGLMSRGDVLLFTAGRYISWNPFSKTAVSKRLMQCLLGRFAPEPPGRGPGQTSVCPANIRSKSLWYSADSATGHSSIMT